ncbi:hypothetical protein FE789_32250 [Burkholderia pseudomallei]|nr:hypothetical protein FE789_32250 [Burkholderia pseudomallei]
MRVSARDALGSCSRWMVRTGLIDLESDACAGVRCRRRIRRWHRSMCITFTMIYTSGSTGQPKGVMVEHRAGCAICSARRAAWFGFDERDVPLFHSRASTSRYGRCGARCCMVVGW